jgi:hypothetical protein
MKTNIAELMVSTPPVAGAKLNGKGNEIIDLAVTHLWT